MGIISLSDKKFEQEVLKSRQLVLVDFWAPWCAPCKMIAPILEKLSQEYDSKLKICKVNVDEGQNLAARYQILSIPALLFFKDGKVVTQLMGLRSAEDIKKAVDSLC